MTKPMENRLALVTGASKGIGAATARAVLEALGAAPTTESPAEVPVAAAPDSPAVSQASAPVIGDDRSTAPG